MTVMDSNMTITSNEQQVIVTTRGKTESIFESLAGKNTPPQVTISFVFSRQKFNEQ